MQLDPHLMLLGMESDAPPAMLLGLTAVEARDPVLIDRALRLRLAQVYQHPEHRTIAAGDMQLVLDSLRNAAEQLRANVRQLGPVRQPRPWVLTEFDRNVLAVLVGYGGWNAQSRARLVALAAVEGVTPNGLMKVIQGLGEYARSGGPALPISEIQPSSSTVTSNGMSSGRSWAISEAIIDKFLPELTEQSTRTTIKLSLLFGLLTLLVGALALRFLLPAKPEAPQQSQQPHVVVQQPAQPAPSDTSDSARVSDTPQRHSPLFTELPTFLGESHPSEALAARERIDEQIAALQEVARRLAVSRNEAAEIIFRSWNEAVEQIGRSWPLLDGTTLEVIDSAIVDVLLTAADTPSVTDRLLASLMPRTGRMVHPLEIWQGTWSSSTLAKIATHEPLPPVVRERAQRQLQVVLGEDLITQTSTPREAAAGSRQAAASSAAAQAYLTSVLPHMVESIEYDPATFDIWELWLSAHRRMSSGEAHNEAVVDAAEAIMQSHSNLSASRRAANVLGRLVTLADFQQSPVVRRRVLRWLDAAAIDSDSLWTLTSILAVNDGAPWFGRSLLVPPDADLQLRGRIRHDLERRWTVAAAGADVPAGAIHVDEVVAANWNRLLTIANQQEPAPRTQPLQLMQQLLIAARLNEAAAYLAAGEHRQTERRLNEAAGLIDAAGTAGAPLPPASSASGRDGEWASQYELVRRNAEEKMQLLQTLRSSQVSDLQPLDAAVLVREALRGTPAEVRASARSALIERFRNGPNVALELLDQFPDAGRSAADLISEFTGSSLVLVDDASRRQPESEWSMQVRAVLVHYVLSLLSDSEIDRVCEQLADSYASQARVLLGNVREEGHPMQPAAAGEMLLTAWNQVARARAGVDIISYESRIVANRHAVRLRLAEGAVQQFVAYQIGVLDLLAVVIAHEQPQLRTEINELLSASSQQRSEAVHVLQQALEVERTINVLWRLRMGLPGATSTEDETT